MAFKTINPATEEVIKEYQELTNSEIENFISQSQKAFGFWKDTSFSLRSDLLINVAKILRQNKKEYAELMTQEMGKPILQSYAEVEKCAWVCEYYAENAEAHLADINIKTEMSKSYAAFLPLGVVLAIMPWNFPFWQVFRFAAPALMAGNVGMLKHARNTMGCGIAIEKIFLEAGLPDNVFTNLVIGSKPVKSIIENPALAAVTLTGSTPVGSQVAAIAGSQIKKTVMELGGSDPYIILKDAALEKAAETCANARLINSGQSCISAKRFIVEKPIYNEFVELFTQKMSEKKMGNPIDDSVFVGPQARKDLQLDLKRQFDGSIAKGAKCTLGGVIPDSKGYYYPPTVLIDVKKGMEVYDEETFGPLAAVIPVENEDEAIYVANDTIFGLGAAIFSSNIEKAENIAKYQLNAGACFVNDFVKSDPRLPFGGIKESGYGRELSVFGIREFMNTKTVCVL